MSCRIDHIDLIFITPFTDAFFRSVFGAGRFFGDLPFSKIVSQWITDLCFFCFSTYAAFFYFHLAFFTRCRNVVLFYPGMLFLIDCFSGTQLFITYAAVGISGIPCATASRFFLVSDLWFMACGVDRMVLSVSTCFTDVSCDSVGCASRCT